MVDKAHKLYSGGDLTPVNDYTDEDWTDWGQTELAMAADGGDSTASTWVVRDEGGVIPDRSGLSGSYFLEAHNVVKTTVGSNTIFNGRLGYDDRKQGRQPAAGVDTHSNKGRAVEFTVTLGDANEHLRGIVVHAWSRPEETDAARVQALVAAYLSGSPRASTNLNGSNYVVTGSNTFTVPAKTYAGVTPGEVLQELAELTDKQMFVDVDENLHYHGNDYSGFSSPVRVSDDPADLDAVTCVPIDASRSEEGRDTLTALRVYWGNNTSGEQNTFQRVDNTKVTVNDYWEDVVFDSESVTWAEASNRASNYFVPRKLDQTSYTVTIGKPGSPNGEPWTSAEIALAPKAGQLIDFKALKARGGRASNGNWIGDTFLSRRIREVRWTFPGPDAYYCQLVLDRPRHSLLGRVPFGTPEAPDAGTPGTPPTAPTTDLFWTFTADSNLLDDGTSTYAWASGGWDANGNPGGRLWWGASGARLNPTFPVTAGTTYTFEADLTQNKTYGNAYLRVEWLTSGGSPIQTDYIAGPGVSYNTWTHYSKVITAPATAGKIYLRCDAAVGSQAGADNIYVKHGGTGGTPATPSTSAVTTVGGTGDGTYADSGQYVPVGSVLEHSYITEGGPYHDADQIAIDDAGGYFTGTEVEAALQELGAASAGSTVAGWAPFAAQVGVDNQSAFGTARTLAAVSGGNGGACGALVFVPAPLKLRSITVWNKNTASARSAEGRVYSVGTSASAAFIAGTDATWSFTPSANSKRSATVSGAPVTLSPGYYLVVVRNTHASNAFDVGTDLVATPNFLGGGSVHFVTASVAALGSTIDVTGWTRSASGIGISLDGEIFGTGAAWGP